MFGQTVEGLDVVEQLTIGDIIKSIVIEGADDDALAEAISHETPRPKSAREVLEELERRRAENEAAAQSQDVVEADGLPVEGQA